MSEVNANPKKERNIRRQNKAKILSGTKNTFYIEKKVQFCQEAENHELLCIKSVLPWPNKTKLVINTAKNKHSRGTFKHPSSKIQYKQKHQASFERDTEGDVRVLYTRKEEWMLFLLPRGVWKVDTDQYQAMKKSQ